MDEPKEDSLDHCSDPADFARLKLAAMRALFARRSIGCRGDRRCRAAYIETFDDWCRHVLPLPSDEKCKQVDEARLEEDELRASACPEKTCGRPVEETKFSIRHALDAALVWVRDPCKTGIFLFSDDSVHVELHWPGHKRRVVIIEALDVPQGIHGKGMMKKLVLGLQGAGVAVSLNLDGFVSSRRY